MRKSIILAPIAAFIAMLVLVGCGADSTRGVQVVGDNIAKLPAGETMVLHKNGKYGFDWIITYDESKSNVHFYADHTLSDDNVDIHVGNIGQEVLFDTGWGTPDMWVSRRDNDSVNIRWEDGLVFQPYEPGDEG